MRRGSLRVCAVSHLTTARLPSRRSGPPPHSPLSVNTKHCSDLWRQYGMRASRLRMSPASSSCIYFISLSTSGTRLGRISKLSWPRECVTTLLRQYLTGTGNCRTLLAAAEKLHWPTPVDYLAASPADRVAFESAFLNLLKMQTMCVASAGWHTVPDCCIAARSSMLGSRARVSRKRGCTLFRR